MEMTIQETQTSSELSISRLAHSYFSYLGQLIQDIDLSAIEEVVSHLRSARGREASVYIMGNGGSAANASHFANDLG